MRTTELGFGKLSLAVFVGVLAVVVVIAASIYAGFLWFTKGVRTGLSEASAAVHADLMTPTDLQRPDHSDRSSADLIADMLKSNSAQLSKVSFESVENMSEADVQTINEAGYSSDVWKSDGDVKLPPVLWLTFAPTERRAFVESISKAVAENDPKRIVLPPRLDSLQPAERSRLAYPKCYAILDGWIRDCQSSGVLPLAADRH